ncbi:MAG: hypothetical protein KA745_08825 [Gemmatimonadales bacterium]|nr:hypothetical protein [Gemmatimonadales bacterium]
MATDYPAGLRVPQTENVTPFDRSQTSNHDRPRESRALSLDRLAVVRATWPPFSPAEAAIFEQWWRVDLYDGGAWFNATWPLPQGRVPAVFRFIEQPRWRFVPGGRWRIEGVLEQRGRGLTVIDGPNSGPPSNPWNSANELGTVVFTDADFTATFSAAATVVSIEAAEGSLGNGWYYAELVPTFAAFEGGAAAVLVGVSRDNPGGPSTGAGFDLSGDIEVDGVVVDNLGALASGDVVMIALDAFSNFIYFGKNGTWLGGADPAAFTGGYALSGLTPDYYLSFFGDNIENSYSCAIRTGTDRFSYSVPAQYTAWNVQGD